MQGAINRKVLAFFFESQNIYAAIAFLCCVDGAVFIHLSTFSFVLSLSLSDDSHPHFC